MKNVLVGGAVALALSMPLAAHAQSQSDIDALKAQVAELNSKIEGLESKQEKSSWAEKIKVKADLRYRYEYIDREGDPENRNRQRIRARIGISGKVNDDTELGFGLRTGGSDPRSGNVTLDGDSASKDIALDLAYAKWAATDSLTVLAGKMKQPWENNPIDYFYDGDYNPEGLAAQFNFDGGFFLNAHLFQIDERSSDDDTYVYGAQLGYAGDMFYVNGSYQGYEKMKGYNPCYQGNCNGNTVDANGDLVYDYQIWALRGGVKLAGFNVFGAYAQNSDPSNDDTAYAVGAEYGTGPWGFGVAYQKVEKDALYGGVVDSDFGGGNTDNDGYAFKGSYALGKNWKFGVTYLLNTIDRTGNKRDYDRLQVDLAWKM